LAAVADLDAEPLRQSDDVAEIAAALAGSMSIAPTILESGAAPPPA
jgi:hypothetical protein